MSIFIKIDPKDLKETKEQVKETKNSILDLNKKAFKIREEIKEKQKNAQRAALTVNSIHEELANLAGLFPIVEPLTSKFETIKGFQGFSLPKETLATTTTTSISETKEINKNKHKFLQDLKDRISGLK